MKKELIIFIPGAKSISKFPVFVQEFVSLAGYLLGVAPPKNEPDHVVIWKKNLFDKHESFICMRWSRGIGSLSLWMAKQKLKHLLNHYKNENITLIGFSLGGNIMIEAIKEKMYANIDKIILICSINQIKDIKFNHPPIFNIYSNKDKFAEIVIEIYSYLSGGEKLHGKNIKNINIPKMAHGDFCSDATIRYGKYKGMQVTDVVKNILKQKNKTGSI